MTTKRNDSTGWKRGAGPYSSSNAGLTSHGNPDSVKDRSSAINSVGNRNGGLAAPVSEGSGDRDSD